MTAYLETSTIIVFLFGKVKEHVKYKETKSLFGFLKSKNIKPVISFYTLHEIYNFCIDNFDAEIQDEVIRLSFIKLFSNKIIIKPLLKREERIVYKNKFRVRDSTDQVHAITAFVNKCECIITYDSHYKDIKDVMNIYTPLEFIKRYKNL